MLLYIKLTKHKSLCTHRLRLQRYVIFFTNLIYSPHTIVTIVTDQFSNYCDNARHIAEDGYYEFDERVRPF